MRLSEIEPSSLLESGSSYQFDEESAKRIIKITFSKLGFLLDLDEYSQLYITFIQNDMVKRVKPDFILFYLGDYPELPSIIPIEVDWRKEELYRHMPKLAETLHVYVEVFQGFHSEVENLINKVSKVMLYNILLAPFSIKYDSSGKYINVDLELFSVKHIIEADVYRKFVEDLLVSFILLLYHYPNLNEHGHFKILKPILKLIGVKTGLFYRITSRAASSRTQDKIHITTCIDDSKDRIRNNASNLNYRGLYGILKQSNMI